MVRLDGYGQEDDRPLELIFRSAAGLNDRGRQGFCLSDAQYKDLIEILPELEGVDDRARAELNFFRDHVLRDCLQADQQPTRAQTHIALTETRHLARDFLYRSTGIGPLPVWAADVACTEPLGPASVFSALPEQLYGFATQARRQAKASPQTGLDDLAAMVDRLATHLKYLDAEPQKTIYDALPRDVYRMRNFADAVAVVRTLDGAITSALEGSKEVGGPRPKTTIKQVVIWLGDWVERYNGEFTHTPRVNGHYDGRVHTPAARFVFRFLKMCDCAITETAVSQFMAYAIEFKKERQAGETSS
ncbi:hypothetical protein IVB27_01905 [Bradyrhizobium sp. 197]|uniref:hypothetical protein n=1 Tax=Bradyrhizobium sp. 197 TaxID=2782663 RepID=UPI001FFA3EEA|nr:hypothetical protein [Bradyrhizobium sp. 197]MCK1473589.1 hypothetical protein [Bradyrhizobium sp. 197]